MLFESGWVCSGICTFYRYKDLFETGGELGLQEISRRKPIVKNRIELQIEQRVV